MLSAFACLIVISITLTSALDGARGLGMEGGGESATGDLEALSVLHARCAVCHSTDLITQQRLDREQWTTIVNKMVHWGAQVSPSEQEMLLTYLAAHYHPDAAPARVNEGTGQRSGHSPIPVQSLPGEAQRGEGLFGRNCVACHGMRAMGRIGPRLAANPILFERERFWETVLEGRGAMPPWRDALTVQEIADIQEWLKTLRE
ncbi:MAG: c-type cytochrome [Nitrospirales bacterium]